MEKIYCCLVLIFGTICTYLMILNATSNRFFRDELEEIKREMKNMKKAMQDVSKLEKKLLVNFERCSLNDNLKPDPKAFQQDTNNAVNLYANDKTAKADFALESAGGRILGVRDTESYPTSDTVRFFGVVICNKANSARAILQPGTLPGECWSFKGNKGCAIIRLLGKIHITGVSLEHISPSISPTGEISTAPKNFTIKGLKSADDQNPDFLGRYTYEIDAARLQYFEVRNCDRAYDIIEFRVVSNHGHPDFTCVYRIKVHGHLRG